jgi:hypothetical protein
MPMKIRGPYDVVVAGAGTAGAIAGIAAARSGARTLLVDQYGSIGGILSLGMGFLGAADGEGVRALGGIGGELVDRLTTVDGATAITVDPLFGSVMGQDPELTKAILTDMALDAGADLLLHTFVADVLIAQDDGAPRVRGLQLANKNGLEIVEGRTFVDCTGDADLVARAGGAFQLGRAQDSRTQPVSCIFRVAGVKLDDLWRYLEDNPDEIAAPPGWSGASHDLDYLRRTPGAHLEGLGRLIAQARQAGELTINKDTMGLYTLPGRDVVGVNVTRVQGIDPTSADDITRAEVETRRQMLEAVHFLRKYVPGFATANIISVPPQVGVRESRHIAGEYTLDADDILAGRDFPDVIGRGAYPLDIHDVGEGGGQRAGGGIRHHKIMRSYGVPMRCLVPAVLDGVVVGGRSISATHEAAASIRGQSVCMVTGHAAGTLAALAADQGVAPRTVDAKRLQGVLASQGAILERRRAAEDVPDIRP